jgi:hypothetical protein
VTTLYTQRRSIWQNIESSQHEDYTKSYAIRIIYSDHPRLPKTRDYFQRHHSAFKQQQSLFEYRLSSQIYLTWSSLLFQIYMEKATLSVS